MLVWQKTFQPDFVCPVVKFMNDSSQYRDVDIIFMLSWLEIEDIMAAKHAHKRQITEFKYGGCIRLSVGKF